MNPVSSVELKPWTAFAPIQLRVAPDAREAVEAGFDLGNGVVLGPTDKKLLDAAVKDLRTTPGQDQRLRRANCFLRVDFEADALGDLATGTSPEGTISKQTVAESKLIDSAVALWVARPSELGFESTFQVWEGIEGHLARQQMRRYLPIRSLVVDYSGAVHRSQDMVLARQLLTNLAKLPDDSAISLAFSLLFRASCDAAWDTRLLTLWTALEAVLGADMEITYRISLRSALLLGKDRSTAKEVFDRVKRLYQLRSKVVHGRSSKKMDVAATLLATEEHLRSVLVAILSDPVTCRAFRSEDERTEFLDGLAFARLPEP